MHHSWRLQAQQDALSRISEWIRASDAKASPLLAISAAMIASLVALVGQPGAWSGSTAYWFALGAALPLASIILVTFAMVPRITGVSPSVLFIGDIARLSQKEYAHRIANLSPTDYLSELVSQCHVNSRVATTKFVWTQRATFALLLAIVPWLIALFVLAEG
jgi:hypothetical protein